MLRFFWIIQILSALLLIMLVLVHSPKGEGILGIGGASNLFASQKNAESGLNKLTMIVAIIFLVATFLIGYGIIGKTV